MAFCVQGLQLKPGNKKCAGDIRFQQMVLTVKNSWEELYTPSPR
jgi:hypothetical protein